MMRTALFLGAAILASWWSGGRTPRMSSATRHFWVRVAGAALRLLVAAGVGALCLFSVLWLTRPLPLSDLLGQWQVYNGDEPEKIAIWEFLRAPRGMSDPGHPRPWQRLWVRGTICAALNLEAADQPTNWCQQGTFGPYEAWLDPTSGIVEFDYESTFGSGTSRLSLAKGYEGDLADDPARTPAAEVDTNHVALVQDPGKRPRARSHWNRGLVAVLLGSWVALLACRLLNGRLFSGGAIRRAASHAAVWLVLVMSYGVAVGPIATSLGDLLAGPWHLEYLANRSRVGQITINLPATNEAGGRPFKVSGESFVRGSTSRGSVTGQGQLPTLFSEKLSFNYTGDRGTGTANLREVPVLVGFFFDRGAGARVPILRPKAALAPMDPPACPVLCRPEDPPKEPNFGDLIALRRSGTAGGAP